LNALYRPGPLRSGMVDDWIGRKQGKTEVTYDLPQLEAVLADTYGVIAYQEQVMRISNVVAGFTLGEADVLRKAMGKKNPEVMAKMRGAFVAGARKLGTSEKKASQLFDLMEHFAGYGFNKSHSTAYAFLAYQTAYLKANYPWHFAASLLTIESQNTDKLALYLGECRDRGIPLLPPDVNQSQLRFTVEAGSGVRFGLTAIKNVGDGAIESLLAVRAKQGRIASLSTLCEALDLRLVNKRVFESLIKAGAFDSLAAGTPYQSLRSAELRPRLLAAVDAACEHGARMQDDRERGQGGLFGEMDHADAAGNGTGGMTLPAAAAWTETEQLGFEKETLGLYWSGHPVDRYAAALKEFGAKTVVDLADAAPSPEAETWGPGGRKPLEPDTAVGGIVAACRQLKTRKGDRMAVFTLEDAVGGVEVVVFPEAYQRAAGLIETGTLVLVRGKLERDDETARILASEIAPLDSVRERIAREVAIRLKKPADRGTLETLGEIFSRHRGDRKISFEVETGEGTNRIRVRVEVSSQIRVRPSPALVADIEQVVGAGAVELR
jgi:DNA polymerase-3 subunit alpha